MGRSVWLLFVVGMAANLGSASCAHYAQPQPVLTYSAPGSCEGACDHYLTCKGDGRPAVFRECVAECRDIFVSNGQADHDSLRDFEELDCEDTVAFVEGTRGGSPAPVEPGSGPVAGGHNR